MDHWKKLRYHIRIISSWLFSIDLASIYTGHNPEGPSHPQIPSIHHPDTPRHQPDTSRYSHFYALERELEESVISEYHDQILCLPNRFDLFATPDTLRKHPDIIQTPSRHPQIPYRYLQTLVFLQVRGHYKKGRYLSIMTKNYVCPRYLILLLSQTPLETIQTSYTHPQITSRHLQSLELIRRVCTHWRALEERANSKY